MRPIYATLSILAAGTLAACSVSFGDDDKPGLAATGSGGERHYAVSNFDKVALAASGDVEVRTGQRFGLTVTGAPGDLDSLKVTQDGGTLGLGRKAGHWSSAGKVHWAVTMPDIAAADIGGSGSIVIDKVDRGQFEGAIGGSGNLSIVAMHVDQAKFSIGGSGDIAAAGKAKDLSLSIAGSGKLRAAPLAAETASISIAGAGNVDATVKSHADVTIMGSGDVTIAGGAQCSVTKMGGGTVRCG